MILALRNEGGVWKLELDISLSKFLRQPTSKRYNHVFLTLNSLKKQFFN